MSCPRCDMKKHRACTCGRVLQERSSRGAAVSRHVGVRLSQRDPVTVGTECSGIEAPIVALRRMGILHTHMYSTECNESARVWSAYNNSPLKRYDNILSRDPSALPSVDIYVCGIPCQDFSLMNQNRSSDVVRCESVATRVIDGIRISQPRSFIVENVPSFRKHALFAALVDTLGGAYDIVDKVLSPHEYGSPQHRKRLYVVGIRKGCSTHDFTWPDTMPLTGHCTDVLTNELTEKERKSCEVSDKYYTRKLEEWNMDATPCIVSLSTLGLHKASRNTHLSPCVLASHPGLYAPHLHRLLHPRELLALQGFSGVILPPSLSNNITRRLAGNAMSVDVLMHVTKAVLRCIGKECESAFADVRCWQ
jgi:site-specific DNA-cytosine methylase